MIPHYGEDRLLERCLEGVYSNVGLTKERVVIVDNNDNNRMFTIGVNEGIHRCLHQSPKYIWILNNDTIPHSDYLEHSLKRFELSEQCGLVGGKNLRMDDPDRIFWGGSGRAFPSGRCKMGRVSKNDLNVATVEPWGPFSSVLVRVDLFSLIGLLDEQFLMICSDSDYCFRIRLAGYKIWYEPKSVVLHHLGASNVDKEAHHPDMLKILQTDQKRFFKKWSRVTGCNDAQALDQAINAYIGDRDRNLSPEH